MIILEKLSIKEITILYGILSFYSNISKFILYQHKAFNHLLQKATNWKLWDRSCQLWSPLQGFLACSVSLGLTWGDGNRKDCSKRVSLALCRLSTLRCLDFLFFRLEAHRQKWFSIEVSSPLWTNCWGFNRVTTVCFTTTEDKFQLSNSLTIIFTLQTIL